MNREIKFRGQRASDNKWIYGDLLQPTELCNIYEISDYDSIDGTRYDVIEDTIGQFTGLHDNNGKEIYEGDILRIDNNVRAINAQVEYSETFAQYIITNTGDIVDEGEPLGDYEEDIEVIGNIYDNPELLGGKDE